MNKASSSLIKVDKNLTLRLSIIPNNDWNKKTINEIHQVLLDRPVNNFRLFFMDMSHNILVFFSKDRPPIVMVNRERLEDIDIHEACAKICINKMHLFDDRDIFRIKDAMFDLIDNFVKLEQKA